MARFTDEELAMLTEDERRQIEELGEEYDEDNDEPPMDPDDDPDEFDGEEEEDSDGGEDTGDDAEGGDDEPDSDAEPDPDTKQDGEEEAASDDGSTDGAEEDPEKAAKDAEQPSPLLNVEMPEGYEDRVKDLDAKREKLDVDFDDGELTSLEYRQQLREIENEERSLREQALKAQIAQEMQETQQRQAWQNTVNSFLDEHGAYRQSRALYRELNDTVIEIANSDEAANMTGEDILAKAHERVLQDPVLNKAFEGGGNPGKEEPSKPEKKAERRNVPPTLHNVPSSDMTAADDGSRFAKLDKLDGLELESELARLSNTNPRLVEEYLAR